jgi:hypothetical protein
VQIRGGVDVNFTDGIEQTADLLHRRRSDLGRFDTRR